MVVGLMLLYIPAVLARFHCQQTIQQLVGRTSVCLLNPDDEGKRTLCCLCGYFPTACAGKEETRSLESRRITTGNVRSQGCCRSINALTAYC